MTEPGQLGREIPNFGETEDGLHDADCQKTAPTPLSEPVRRLVLVVDDSASNQMIADAMLKALGYDVSFAMDGIEAIASCHRAAPHMVLMDIEMPLMGGLEATRLLRILQREGYLPHFPIVAATGGFDSFLKSACLDAGMDGCLKKPLNGQLLADQMHSVLSTS